jgi:hypothetical protein
MHCVVKYEFVLDMNDDALPFNYYGHDVMEIRAETLYGIPLNGESADAAGDMAQWWCECCPCCNESVLLIGLTYGDFA